MITRQGWRGWGVFVPIRVMLADAFPVCLHGLRRVLEADPDLHVVAEVRSVEELIPRALALRPDVIVLDHDLGGTGGAAALASIRAADESIRAVVVSARGGEWTDLAFDAGASAYRSKYEDLTDLPAVVRQVAEGRVLSPPRPPLRGAGRPIPLTPRETEVLKLIVEGLSSKEIAAKLGTAVSTVEKHRESIRKKTNLHNTAEIVRFGFLFFAEKRLRDLDDDPPPGAPHAATP